MANIIITGSSRGIGFQLAQLFANEGHKVLALSRNNAPIAALNHPNISSFPFDLGKGSNYNQLDEFLKNNWKQVDILINNAGKLLNRPFLETSMEAFEEVYKVNVFGVANITKRIIPLMPKEHHFCLEQLSPCIWVVLCW